MQTRNGKVLRLLGALAIGMAAVVPSTVAQAQTDTLPTSQYGASYVVFPKIVVDTNAVLPSSDGIGRDTVIQIANTDLSNPHRVNCWYVNANSFCSNALPSPTEPNPVQCESNADCASPGICTPLWRVQDFTFRLTPGQPFAWRVSEGSGTFLPCDPLNLLPSCGIYTNDGTVPRTNEDPFRGELKCVEVDEGDLPVGGNDIIGEATLYRVTAGNGGLVDTAAYNGIGFQVNSGNADLGVAPGVPNNLLCLGGPSSAPNDANCPFAEYAGCPAVLIVDHYFEGAISPVNGLTVSTSLTLVPCTENLVGGDEENLLGNQVVSTAQMLVYNEFEQRFSTATRVDCYRDVALSDIDTRQGSADDASSIFAVGVQGTLTGQTRIRGVEGIETNVGHGLLAVAEEQYSDGVGGVVLGSAAINVGQFGQRSQRDVVSLPLPEDSGGSGLSTLCGTCTGDGDCFSGLVCKSCVVGTGCPVSPPTLCAPANPSQIDCGSGVGSY